MKGSNRISSGISYRDRIDHIATACLYCWHLWVSNAGRRIDIGFNHIIRLVVSIIVPKRYRKKIYRNLLNSQKAIAPMHWDLECGQHIRIAKNLVTQTYGGYMAFPLAIVGAIICSIIGWDVILFWRDGIISIIMPLMVGLLLYIGLSHLTKTIEDPQVYLSFFKKFEQQDNEWLKKWKRNTILLFVGSLLSAALGICFVFYSFMHT